MYPAIIVCQVISSHGNMVSGEIPRMAVKPPITSAYRSGEGLIKAETILASWLKYCRESKLYRILEFFGLK